MASLKEVFFGWPTVLLDPTCFSCVIFWSVAPAEDLL